MTQLSVNPGALTVKPQSNVYTLLVAIAILALLATLVIVINTLTTPVAQGGYGIEFGAIFDPSKLPKEIQPAVPK